MKSTLEAYMERIKNEKEKNNLGINEQDSKEMGLIIKFIMGNEELSKLILKNATRTIKTIQPSILFEDFQIAMSMEMAIVCDTLYYLAKKGYLKIEGVSVEKDKNKF